MEKEKKAQYSLASEGRHEIEVKLRGLLETCQSHGIPMFATVAVANSEEGTEYNRIVYAPASHGIRLKEDQIRHHILIADGFHAVPEREDIPLDLSGIL